MFIQLIINGLAIGSIYALVAFGFVLIFKTTEILNFAQGEFLIVPAFLSYSLLTFFKVPLPITLIITIIFSGILGLLLERTIIVPMLGSPILSVIIATFGLSILLKGFVGMIWTHEIFRYPNIIPKEKFIVYNYVVSTAQVLVILSSLVLVIILFLFFKYTKYGTAMRATFENQLAATYMGINIRIIYSLTWVISAVIAAIGGILVSPLIFLYIDMGSNIFLKAFPAAVLGGFGSFPGAILGGYIIGIVESFAGVYLPKGIKEITPHLILIAVLFIKPSGIFGIHHRKKV